jgi:hypothetical protein
MAEQTSNAAPTTQTSSDAAPVASNTPAAPAPVTPPASVAAAAKAAAEARTQAVDQEDSTLLASMLGDDAPDADAEGADGDDAEGEGKSGEPEGEEDVLEGINPPGVKGDAKADPKASRLDIARGEMALLAQGLSEDDLKGITPERLAEIGRKAASTGKPAGADPDDELDTTPAATATAPAPVASAELDAVLSNALIDKDDQAAIRTAFTKAVQATADAQAKAGIAPHIKALQAAVNEANQATAGMLRMRFHTAIKPLLTEFPRLKDKAAIKDVVDMMDHLDPASEIGKGPDDQRFTALLRRAVFAAMGDKIAGDARRGMVTKGRQQARGVAEAPVGGANAAASKRSQGDEDDAILQAIQEGRLPGQMPVGTALNKNKR